MIAFACATTDDDAFRRGAAQTIARFLEGDSLLLRRHGYDSAAQAFNEMLVTAAAYEDLEALVLLGQDVRVEDDLLGRVRNSLVRSEDVAVVGAGSAHGVEEVEVLDGGLAALSAWAVRELRFDESISGPIECCLPDLCLRASARGRRVLADDTRVLRASLSPERGVR